MKIGILALGRPTFDVQYAKERLTASLNYLSSTNHNILGSCELLLDEQDALNEINKFKNEDLDFIIIIQVTFTDSSTLLISSAKFCFLLSYLVILSILFVNKVGSDS